MTQIHSILARISAFLIIFLTATLARAEVDIQQIETPGGVSVWLVEDHAIPFVALRLVFDGGAALDPSDKRGAANLMTGLIEEGAGDMDAQAFQTAREALAADFGFDLGDDTLSVSARFLSENRDEAVALLSQALTAPRFDDDAVERVRAQVMTGLRSDEVDPNSIAGRAFDARVFGDHPYGSDLSGTPDSVAALTRDDLLSINRALLVRDRAHVAAVGDITADDLAALVDGLLADLPATGPALPAPVTPMFDGGTHLEPFDTPQSVALFGQPGLPLDHPDYIAAYMLNEIIGGSGLQSLLMQEVREERGLTYGIYSYLVEKEGAQLWLGSFASGNGAMAEAVLVVRDTWARVARDGVTADELAAVKTYLTGSYPLRFDGNQAIARILTGMQLTERPPSYITERNDLINAVTLEQINRVAADLMDPDKLTFVIAGAPEGLGE